MAIHKKIIAAFMMVIYLLAATAGRELFKLPLLAEHYYDHKGENIEIGLLSFLTLHYITEDGSDKDANEDNQLPFKSSAYFSAASFVSSVPPASGIIVAIPVSVTHPRFTIPDNLLLPSPCLAAVWQPPRYC